MPSADLLADLKIANSLGLKSESNNDMGETNRTIYYAIVIFHEADYTGGQGL